MKTDNHSTATKTRASKRRTKIRTTKPRSDATLEGLSAERREQLACWLLDENRGYVEVRERAAREWGVKTSHSALGRYYRQRLVPLQLAEAEEAAEAMDGVDGPPSPRLRRGHERFGEAARRRAQQLGFMALMQPEPDWKAARVYLGIVDDFERRELTRDRLKLAQSRERRCARRDAPPRKSGIWKLPYEERMRHLKGIFGIAPDYEFAAWMTEEEKAIHLRRPGETRSAEAREGHSETTALRGTGDGKAEFRGCGTGEAREEGQTGEAVGEEGITNTITIKSTNGEAQGPGVPGSFREGHADPAVFSSGAGDEAKERASIQPQITPIPRMGLVANSQVESAGVAAIGSGNAELGTRNGQAESEAERGRSETSPLHESADTAMRASKSETVTRVASAAGCRSHGQFGPVEVSFGRVLGAEGSLRTASVPAVQPVLPSDGIGVAPESRTESVRGVANWQVGGLAVFGGSLPIWPRPEPIF